MSLEKPHGERRLPASSSVTGSAISCCRVHPGPLERRNRDSIVDKAYIPWSEIDRPHPPGKLKVVPLALSERRSYDSDPDHDVFYSASYQAKNMSSLRKCTTHLFRSAKLLIKLF
ncbi:hypothetical protein GGR55DRAFT_681886 [Xylaria sp. FL0064]|nr:hypothetical protein GGR55DRAFT_681886 [Xylaria sp. FL0064]